MFDAQSPKVWRKTRGGHEFWLRQCRRSPEAPEAPDRDAAQQQGLGELVQALHGEDHVLRHDVLKNLQVIFSKYKFAWWQCDDEVGLMLGSHRACLMMKPWKSPKFPILHTSIPWLMPNSPIFGFPGLAVATSTLKDGKGWTSLLLWNWMVLFGCYVGTSENGQYSIPSELHKFL